MSDARNIGELSIKIASFNILAPPYKKVKIEDKFIRESELTSTFLERNKQICALLLRVNPDVICIQEFWETSSELKELYKEQLCDEAGYLMLTLPRTSHWRKRDDGLAMFIKESKLVLQDYQEILFHDCGDRVAQLALLAVRPTYIAPIHPFSEQHAPLQQFICVNTHLLFPHNTYSTNIRLREVTKIMGFVESYRQLELCTTICGRDDVRIPVLIAGDFNGSPRGAVYSLMTSQNYRSALEEAWKQQVNESVSSTAWNSTLDLPSSMESSRSLDVTAFSNGQQPTMTWESWISHRNHRNEKVAVDQIFYLNPSEQVRTSGIENINHTEISLSLNCIPLALYNIEVLSPHTSKHRF